MTFLRLLVCRLHMRNTPRKTVGFALLALVLLPACTRKGPGADAKFALQVQMANEPVTLDPSLAEDGISMKILANVMDGLMCHDGQGKLRACLAQSFKISPDGKRYEFTLRPEAAWSDGLQVTADHFVAGFRHTLDPATGSKLAPLLYPIQGAQAYNQRKATMGTLGVRADGEKLIIDLERPTPYFPEILTLPLAGPYRSEPWTEKSPVTGAYRIGHHRIDDHLILEANDYYWGRPVDHKVFNRPVMLRVVPDESTALSLFQSGKLDILTKVPALDFKRLKESGQLRVDPFLATYYLAFNTRKPPFNELQARRAVAGSIRREEITQVLGTGEKPARSWIPAPLEGAVPYEDPSPVFADSVKAYRASHDVGNKMVQAGSIVASLDGSTRNTLILEKVQSDLKKNLDLAITLNPLDWRSYVKSLAVDPAPIYRFGWLAAFNDPISHLQVFTSRNPNNYTGWSSTAYDALVDKIASMPSGSARVDLIHRAQSLLVDREAVVVPLFHYLQIHAVSARVKKFQVSPFGVIRFDEIGMGAN